MFTHPAITTAFATQQRRDLPAQADADRLTRAVREGQPARRGAVLTARQWLARRAVTALASASAAVVLMASPAAASHFGAQYASASHFESHFGVQYVTTSHFGHFSHFGADSHFGARQVPDSHFA